MDVLTWVRAQWDRLGAGLAVACGALALLLGWLGTSRSGFPAEQIPYVISGGIGGLFLLGAGSVLWLSADLRDEWRKLDDLDHRLTRLTTHATPREAPVVPDEPIGPEARVKAARSSVG